VIRILSIQEAARRYARRFLWSNTMKPVHLALILALIVLAFLAPARSDLGAQANHTGLSIVEEGADSSGNHLYTIHADNVDIKEVLRAFLKKTDQELAIDQDVAGTVPVLDIRNKTFHDALQWIVNVAQPRIKIVKVGSVYHVTRDLDAIRKADAASIAERAQQRIDQIHNGGFGGAGGSMPSVVPMGSATGQMRSNSAFQNGIPMDRNVSISVPEGQPIPLSQVLEKMSAQTGFSIVLDPRVPRELSFSGTITEAQLPLVLQTIATTSGLKLVANGTQAIFSPTDQFTLRLGGNVIGVHPSVPCSRCRQPVSPFWNYCPHCGQIIPRGMQQNQNLNGMRRSGAPNSRQP
jgi:hypothetical protein